MAKQFWVRINGREQGPFSSAQLKRFAEQGQLKHEHEVSVDQMKWVTASSVKGLPLEAPPPTEDDLLGASWDAPAATGADPLGDPLADLAPPPDDLWGDLPPTGMSSPAGFPAPAAIGAPASPGMAPASFASGPGFPGGASAAPGASESVAVRWPTGVTIGVVVGFVLLMSGCVLTAAAAGALEESPAAGGVIVMIGMGGLVLSLAIFICSALGSKTDVALSAGAAGTTCTVTRRLAFLPIHSEEFLVTPNDTLHKNIHDRQSVSFSPGMADILMIVFTIGLCMMGAFPGILIWVIWWRARNNDQHSYSDVTLTLNAYNRGGRLRLWKKKVQDYRGTRFGDPPELDKLLKMFARFNGPRVVVEEM